MDAYDEIGGGKPYLEMAERFEWRDILSGEDADKPEVAAMLDKHFEPFAKGNHVDGVEKGLICINCGAPQTGLMLGMFRWDIVHGEGRCGHCGWPARAIHYIKDEAGETAMTLRNMVIQYHPDFVSKRGNEDSEPK